MIRLNKNYGIIADEHQYVLVKISIAGEKVKLPRKPGDEIQTPVLYYPTMSCLLRATVKRLQREAVMDGTVTTLQDAIALFRRIEAETRALVFPGEEQYDG